MSEHDQRHGARRPDAELDTEQRPRTPLQLHVPNDVSEFAIRRFVEGIISELKRSPVGVEYTSTILLGTKRTQYIAQGSGTMFQKRLYVHASGGWRRPSDSSPFRTNSSPDSRLIDQLRTASGRDAAITVGFAPSTSFVVASIRPRSSSSCPRCDCLNFQLGAVSLTRCRPPVGWIYWVRGRSRLYGSERRHG